jgi:hypothetical protein
MALLAFILLDRKILAKPHFLLLNSQTAELGL